MKLCLPLLLIIALSSQLFSQQTNCRYTDSLSLVALNNSISNLDWDTNKPIDTWSGVYLNENNCVEKLDLSNRNLSGTVAPELNNIDQLRTLDLSNNNLSGEILKHLTEAGKSLRTLDLSNNQFTEEVTAEAKFESWALNQLNLSNNNFSGNYLSSIVHPNIRYQNIANNQFNGEFLYYWGVIEIHAQNNSFEGEIPYSNFYDLEVLNFSGNQLTGEIPHTLGDSSNLKELNLENNLLSGCFHKKFRNFCNRNVTLEFGNNFDISWSNFCNNGAACGVDPSCTVSDSLNLIALSKAFDCRGWDITEPVSSWHYILLNNNNCLLKTRLPDEFCKGYIPPEIGNFKKLTNLVLNENGLGGSIPKEIGKLTQLKVLDIYENHLTGEIPKEITNLINLEILDLSENGLSGELPKDNLVNLKKLKTLDLFRNSISGPIPPEIENLKLIEVINFRENELSGSIPTELLNLQNLKLLRVSDNQLTGCFDSSLSALCDIASFNRNNFEGSWVNFCQFGASSCDETYPCRLNDSLSLVAFYKSVNGLNWDITQPINQWEGVKLNSNNCVNELILPSKNLSGEISFELENINYLKKVDLSNNNLNVSFHKFGLNEISNIEILNLSNNEITTRLFSVGRSFPKLKYLDLSNNLLPFFDTDDIKFAKNIEYIDLSNNNFQGSIRKDYSDFVYYLPKLYYFNISQNNLSGDYPSSFLNLCDRLASEFNSNAFISDGNAFNINWDDFCNEGISNCLDNLSFYFFDDFMIYENIYEANREITTYHQFEPNSTIIFKANEAINLSNGTTIDSSTDFTAKIGACQ